MNLLYLSVHSIAEYEELKLFTDLGISCISQGCYNDPTKLGADEARPKLKLPYDPELNPLAKLEWVTRVDAIPERLIDWADVIYSHGFAGWYPVNWERIKRKHVVFRGNGQNSPPHEALLAKYRAQGLKVVRYSPVERFTPGYCGEDAMIRFYKDETEYKDWNGSKAEVVTVAQSIRKREAACKFSVFDGATSGYPRKVYGTGNEDLGDLWGGRLEYEELKAVYRDNRAYVYTGTCPAPYTMNFQEAWTTGIPVVAAGSALMGFNLETPYLIENGVSGYVYSSVSQMHDAVGRLLDDPDEAAEISKAGRETAIHYFGYDKIRDSWKRFFDSL